MPDPKEQMEAQLRNIEQASGKTVADFTAIVRSAGLEKHGQIVALLKSDHGLTHGNANLIAHLVRESIAGGPLSAPELLAAQYAGAKEALLPIYVELASIAEGMGDDVTKVVQKTGVSFRRKKQFALVQAPSSKRIQLGLNLDDDPPDDRVVVMGGMCTHKMNITEIDAIDEAVMTWIRQAYERAG
jgi:predicted transport protein